MVHQTTNFYLSAKLFRKPKSDENTLMIAQCYLKLGELGLEIENYSQSVGDFLECLSLYKVILLAPAICCYDCVLTSLHASFLQNTSGNTFLTKTNIEARRFDLTVVSYSRSVPAV